MAGGGSNFKDLIMKTPGKGSGRKSKRRMGRKQSRR